MIILHNFTAYLQEAEYKDGAHTNESFSYIVLEAGTWELDNGSLLEVGMVIIRNFFLCIIFLHFISLSKETVVEFFFCTCFYPAKLLCLYDA